MHPLECAYDALEKENSELKNRVSKLEQALGEAKNMIADLNQIIELYAKWLKKYV